MDILPPTSTPALPAASPNPPQTAVSSPSFKDVLNTLAQRMDSGEQSVQQALQKAPAQGAAGELIALQASVYRYTETFELAAKMVDKATSGMKTVLQGQ